MLKLRSLKAAQGEQQGCWLPAVKLADFLLLETPAAVLGKKGRAVMAKRRPEYFRKIAAVRKERKGGATETKAQLTVLLFFRW